MYTVGAEEHLTPMLVCNPNYSRSIAGNYGGELKIGSLGVCLCNHQISYSHTIIYYMYGNSVPNH